MLANEEALASRKPIGTVLQDDSGEGVVAAVAQYRELKTTQLTAYDYGEDELIGLGYVVLHMKKFADELRFSS